MKTKEEVLTFYRSEKDAYEEHAISLMNKLEKGNMDEVSASRVSQDIDECRLIVSLLGGFIENLENMEVSK